MRRGGESALVATVGPARLPSCVPELGQSFLTGEKDVAGSSEVLPLQNMTSLTWTEYLRRAKNLLRSVRSLSSGSF